MPLPNGIKAYKAEIRELNEAHDLWSIRDDRVLFFLPQFVELVGDVRVIWSDIDQTESSHLHKRIKPVYDGFRGQKLCLLKKADSKKVAGWLKGNVKEDDGKRLSN